MKISRDPTELNDLVFWFSLIQKLMRIGRNSSIRYMESGCSMDPEPPNATVLPPPIIPLQPHLKFHCVGPVSLS